PRHAGDARAAARLIPTAEIVDSSNDFDGWYRAPGWRAAARRTKTHTNGPEMIGYPNDFGGWYRARGWWGGRAPNQDSDVARLSALPHPAPRRQDGAGGGQQRG